MITLESTPYDPFSADAGLEIARTEIFCSLMEAGAFSSPACRQVLTALCDGVPHETDPYRVRLPDRVLCFASLPRWVRTALTVTACSETAPRPPVFALDTELRQAQIFWLLNSLSVPIHLCGDRLGLRRLYRALWEFVVPLPIPACHPAWSNTPYRLLTDQGPVLTFQPQDSTDENGQRLIRGDGFDLLGFLRRRSPTPNNPQRVFPHGRSLLYRNV